MRKALLFIFVLLAIFGFNLAAQNRTITGTITSGEDGQPLPGVNITVQGTTIGSISDVDGKYSITVPTTATTLTYSFLGFVTENVTLTENSVVDVVLSPDITALSEVVVTALGITREKKSLGYAITEISGKEVSEVKDLNVVNSLAGKVAGLVITQGTFGPGSSSRIVIRGNNSITGNNQPLFVVDGIPIDNSGSGSASQNEAGEYAKTDYGSGISDINPDDIASMSILKGPNAAALYGSRASNGVILITTKTGSAQKGLGVTYNTNYTWETPMLLPTFQNEYGQGTGGNVVTNLDDLHNTGGSWGAKMDGSSQLYYNGETRPYSAQPNNVKDFFNTGSSWINSIAFDGGSDKYNFRFSYTNTDVGSILPNSTLKRNNFNLRAFTKLTNSLSVDAKVTYFNQDAKNRPTMGTEGVMAYLYPIPRNIAISDLQTYQDPSNYQVLSYLSGSGNPYWYMKHDINNDQRDRIQGFSKVTLKLNNKLSVFGRIGTDVINQRIENVNQYGHWFYPNGRLTDSENRITETNIDGLIMYSDKITDKIDIMVNAGANHLYSTYEGSSIFAENFKIPTSATLESASNNLPSYTPLSKKVVNSVYGTISLSYDKFLYLESSLRNDWSSTLPKNNWSYFYPSVGVSAIISELLKADFFDFGKIRLNWARVGSDTDPYQLQNAFNISAAGDSYLGLTVLTRPEIKYDLNLKPEQAGSTEIGGEFRFLKNRIYTDLSYYDIKSTNLIMNVDIPASTGYSKLHTNVGEMENKGFEILLGGIPVKMGDFSWDISLNYSKNKNTLNKLITGVKEEPLSTSNSGSILVKAVAGGGFGDLYATTYERDANGKIVLNADGTFKAATDKKYVGNYQPDWTGGLSNTITFKSLSLRFLIDARVGGKVYSGTDANMDANGTSENSLQYRTTGVIIDGVMEDGTANTTNISAQQYWSSYAAIAENYIFDQTNIRLRELTFSYQLPKSIVDKVDLRNVSIGITGRNLFFLYNSLKNFDPEGSFSTSNYAQGVLFFNMPTIRSFGFNINVSF